MTAVESGSNQVTGKDNSPTCPRGRNEMTAAAGLTAPTVRVVGRQSQSIGALRHLMSLFRNPAR